MHTAQNCRGFFIFKQESMTPLFTKKEVAELFKVSEATIHRLIISGELISVKIKGQVRFTESHLNNYLKSLEI